MAHSKLVFAFLCSVGFMYFGNSQSISFSKNTSADYVITTPLSILDNSLYGFDFGTEKNVKFYQDGFTAKSSVYVSMEMPEGNYHVEVTLGSDKKPSVTTIKAESRRLMVEALPLNKKETKVVSFNLHIHHKTIGGTTQEVSLKSREVNELDWDTKLTLEFLGTPAVKEIKITPANNVTTLFLAGDSTVTDQDLEPWASWGQFFTNYVGTNAVVANYAFSGATLQSFKSMKRLEKVLTLIKEGDYLLVEFGHNDEKIKGEGNGAYGLYSNLLREFIDEARSRGAYVIFLTPTQRRAFESGKLIPTHGDFPDAMRTVAKTLNVPVIDLTEITSTMYQSWGDLPSRKAFVQYPPNTFPGQDKELEDNTHFNGFGANEIALAVVNEIKAQHLKLAAFFKKDTPAYNPEKPNNIQDWTLPMSPRFDNTKPYGN